MRGAWSGLILAALLSVTPVHASAAPLEYLPALQGDYFLIKSWEAGHDYHIYVRLPQGYKKDPTRRYPIVYLLDGDSLFPIIGSSHLFLTIDDKMPEAIVVGIAYGSFEKPINRRHVDFTPPGPEIKPEDAGVVQFHNFLERELLPQVEERYRADPSRRILFGQSRGGALILYSAFTKPDLFWARIASNPSWVPGEEIFFGPASQALRKDLSLLVALGSDEYPDRLAAAARWFDHVNARQMPWKVTRIDIPGGTHSADSGNAYRAAMRLLFPDR